MPFLLTLTVLIACTLLGVTIGWVLRGDRVQSRAVSTLLVRLAPERERFAPDRLREGSCECGSCAAERRRAAN